MSFADARPALLEALTARGYAQATPVQAAVLAEGARGRDLLVSAQTGSGKTVAYGLALAETLLGAEGALGPAGAPRALIVAPTRELAMQVAGELGWLFARAGARIATAVGGYDPRVERRTLDRGAHVVVGTPGRLCDHLSRGSLDLSRIEALVLDEADEMLDLGFREDLEKLLGASPAARRTLLFSATLPEEIVALAVRHLKEPLRIAVGGEDEPHGDIEYRAVLVPAHEREHAVVNVLRWHEARGALVFCATRETVRHLHGNLLERGFAVVALSGEMGQAERTRALQALRDGRARVCVATDVAARGLDLPDLGLVVHGDLPHDPQVLLHRSGRTGRAGRKGTCVLLVPFTRRRAAERLISGAGVEASWSPPPSADEIRARDRERLVAALRDASADGSEEDLEVAREVLKERTAEQLAAALVRVHRERMPSPEEIALGGPARDRVTPRERAPRDAGRERPPRAGRPAHEGAAGDELVPHRAGEAPRARREPRAPGSTAWFNLNVGRVHNADPRWLVPMLCRRGGITKAELGAIKIFDENTRFEVAAEVAGRFAAAVRRPDPKDPRVRIDPVRTRGPRPPPRGNRPAQPDGAGGIA